MEILRNSMVDRREPTRPRHWSPLRIGDGNQAHIVEFPKERVKIGNIKPTVKRGDSRNLEPSNLRKRQIVEVKVHNIEFVRFLRDGFDEIQMMSQRREQFASVKTKCTIADGSQARRGL